jgi:hypothetical protein
MLTIVYYMAFCKWKILHNERLIFDAVRKEGGGNGEGLFGVLAISSGGANRKTDSRGRRGGAEEEGDYPAEA